MYEPFFGLDSSPFGLTPNPRFLFRSSVHHEILSLLLYGVTTSKGVMLLLGDVGTGKTTLCRALLRELPAEAESVLLLNPHLSETELVGAILDDLGLERRGKTRGELMTVLSQHLLAAGGQGKTVVVVVDEAQHMSVEALEQARILSTLEAPDRKLLQIVLAGQPGGENRRRRRRGRGGGRRRPRARVDMASGLVRPARLEQRPRRGRATGGAHAGPRGGTHAGAGAGSHARAKVRARHCDCCGPRPIAAGDISSPVPASPRGADRALDPPVAATERHGGLAGSGGRRRRHRGRRGPLPARGDAAAADHGGRATSDRVTRVARAERRAGAERPPGPAPRRQHGDTRRRNRDGAPAPARRARPDAGRRRGLGAMAESRSARDRRRAADDARHSPHRRASSSQARPPRDAASASLRCSVRAGGAGVPAIDGPARGRHPRSTDDTGP